jgi:uncharacterized protein
MTMAELPRHLAGLLRADAYPHEVREIRLIETHISWVLLTGEYAYKIKRPVKFPFVDLSSMERRAFYCSEELRLNRRFAPELYLDTCEVREDGASVHIGGTGRIVDHCVKMKQFARTEELDRLLEAGQIEPDALAGFGRELADIHAKLPVAQQTDPWGSAERVRQGMLENVQQYQDAAARAGFDSPTGLGADLTARLDAVSAVIDRRRANGRVRECHGDLHTRNIVRRGTRLVAFDCMEFEPAFRWIDVAEDIALLMADLRARGFARHAHAFLADYLTRTGDFGLCRVLDLYRAHRALTRAKVAAFEKSQADHDAQMAEVRGALSRKSPLLTLMSGLSGSGKTWLARRLAPDLGAVHIRSDIERKRMSGLAEHADSHSQPGAGLYSAGQSERVYDHLAECAEDVIAGGYSAIVDAAFLLRAQRSRFVELARRLSVPVQVVVCEAPLAMLRKRVADRHTAGTDASEADLAVLEWQMKHQEPIQSAESLPVIKVSANDPADPFAQLSRRVPGVP